jgi:hypothetical protein
MRENLSSRSAIALRLTTAFLLFLSFARGLTAAEQPGMPVPTNVIRQIGTNSFQIGEVRLDAKERRLTIPATVNMVEGLIEYVLVSANGKLHESIFKTTAEPIHIQTAALLLLKAPIDSNSPPQLRVSVELPAGKVVPAEDLITNTMAGVKFRPGPWRYNGSRVVENTFIAQRDGSIVAIMADPDAIIESGRIPSDDDDNWRPHKSELPPIGAPVKLQLTFDSPANLKKQ